MIQFPSKYKFDETEPKWQQLWQEKNIYHWNRSEARENTFVVDTPPPTVSGNLHIGHVYSYTHTDFIVRHRRMKGMNIFYPMGFDDNGLPTERLVEKKHNIRAATLERQEFIRICKEVVQGEEARFRTLFRRIALSVDWGLEYQTISRTSIAISQMSFLDLADKGEVYRDSQPMLWDPVDQTALAQADIEEHEKTTFMNEIKFFLEDGTPLNIATTRPELLPACVCVFFHPDDERYKHLAGKSAISPLFGVYVPLLADDLVDPEKGTGLVMCCTFGDQTDVLWWRKHKLPTKIIISKQGRIENIAFDEVTTTTVNPERARYFAEQLAGLKVIEARNKIIELLQKEGLLLGQSERLQTVKCAERSGAPLEILTTPQWFIKVLEHKHALLQKSSELNWYPRSMKIKLDKWIENLNLDWCISRQRYFGVPFPVWYSKRPGEEGKVLFAKAAQLPVDPCVDLPNGYSREEVVADMDVMDTWSTSAVSPQLSSHGIAENYMIDKERHKKLFPADLRPQAHEILRTWAFYTILKSYLHENTLPWTNIMISGWCLAQDKSKMSKSKGNILVPDVLLGTYGADVIRYWASNSKLGTDTTYSEDVMNNGKRLINKLWNAAKFVSSHFDKIPREYKTTPLALAAHKITHEFDRYLLWKLMELVKFVDQALENYEYQAAMHQLEHFFWSLFCDNYLEITKIRAYNESGAGEEQALSAHLTLYHSMQILLKMFAPILPHITEELYQILYADREQEFTSIHQRGIWPDGNDIAAFEISGAAAIEESEVLLEILELVRKMKARENLSVKAPLEYIEVQSVRLSQLLTLDLQNVTSAREIRYVETLTSDDGALEGEKVRILVSPVPT